MWINKTEFTSEFEHPQRNVSNLSNQLLEPIKCLHILGFFSMMGSANHSASPQPPGRGGPTSILFPPFLSPCSQSGTSGTCHARWLSLGSSENWFSMPTWQKTNAAKKRWFSAGWLNWKKRREVLMSKDGTRQVVGPCGNSERERKRERERRKD